MALMIDFLFSIDYINRKAVRVPDDGR